MVQRQQQPTQRIIYIKATWNILQFFCSLIISLSSLASRCFTLLLLLFPFECPSQCIIPSARCTSEMCSGLDDDYDDFVQRSAAPAHSSNEFRVLTHTRERVSGKRVMRSFPLHILHFVDNFNLIAKESASCKRVFHVMDLWRERKRRVCLME